jgi:hypothetical protein
MKLFQFTRRSRTSSQSRNENLHSSDGIFSDNNSLLRNDFLSPPAIHRASTNPNSTLPNGPTSRRRDHNNRFSYKVMKCLGNLLAITSTLTFLIAVPVIAYHAIKYEKARPDFAAFYSAGAFVCITLIMSTKLIYDHLTNWYMPDVQKYVVRILYMVPLYAIQSWLSLRFHNARIYIDVVRDLYEAYVIQSFMYFLMELLGGEDTLVQILQEKDPHYGIHLGFVRFIIPKWEMGFEFMANCKHGVLQYVVLKALGSISTATLEMLGMFHEGEFSWFSAYIYISFIINLSQMWALYCLVKFYHATHDNLASPVNWKPLGKFLCIKLVVFFTWWQGVAIAVLKSYDLIGDVGQWDVDDVANGLQDYLICIEMFCFAIAHSFTFTHKEYLPNRTGAGGGYAHVDENDSSSGEQAEGDISLDYTEFRPPVIRTLNTPMGFRDALWSTTMPNETLNDIRRFRNGTTDQGLDDSSDIGMLRNVSMQHAESV